MIDGIRRRLAKPIDVDHWGLDQEPYPDNEENSGLQTDTAVLVAPTGASGQYVPDDGNSPDYYKSLVQTAIENGGRHGDQRISISWLRMILAGLESKRIDPEMMWYGVEAGDIATEPPTEIPSYETLFLSDGDGMPRP